jgi:hypothetical protein
VIGSTSANDLGLDCLRRDAIFYFKL